MKSFLAEVEKTYGTTGCGKFQIELLKKTTVPEDWADAIRAVYGERWDDDVKKSGYVLERAYLACLVRINDMNVAVNPLWGKPNLEQDAAWLQEIEEYKVQIMATKLGATYGQTCLVENSWSDLLFYFSALDRMVAKMGYKVEVCPYCRKQIRDVRCECGFPNLDPDCYTKRFTEEVVRLVETRKLIAVCPSVDHPGISWLDNGEFRWDDFTETEEGNIKDRYVNNGFKIFRPYPQTFLTTHTSCGGLVSSPRDFKEYSFVKIIWGDKPIGSVKPMNGECMYSLGNQPRGQGYFAWLRKGLRYTATKARMSREEPPEEISFTLEDYDGVDIYYSPYSLYRGTCVYGYGELTFPDDLSWLETMEGLRVIHRGIMPRGISFKIVGGSRNGEVVKS